MGLMGLMKGLAEGQGREGKKGGEIDGRKCMVLILVIDW